MGDGLPLLLTHARFHSTMKDHEEAKETEKVDKEARKVAWMEQVKVKKKWEEEVAKMTEQNHIRLAGYVRVLIYVSFPFVHSDYVISAGVGFRVTSGVVASP